jgi:LacI family transcriptional regulator
MRKTRQYSIKQISAQSGVSKATVDRALHNRGQVNPQTQRRIEHALIELEEQQNTTPMTGRTFYIDIVMHAPSRFCQAVRQAINAQLAILASFRIRPRFHLFEDIKIEELQRQLNLILKRGSHGIILKAPNDPIIVNAVYELYEKGIPTVTLVTDLPTSHRIIYSGMQNQVAGETAAYLMKNWLTKEPKPQVLVVMSKDSFLGEEQRASAFFNGLKQQAKHVEVHMSEGSYGMDERMYQQINQLLDQSDQIHGVYSVGGGNNAILQAFTDRNLPTPIFIGHDLDRDNQILLENSKIQAVLHHDLQHDAQRSFHALLQYHNALPKSDLPESKVEVITPFNIPI